MISVFFHHVQNPTIMHYVYLHMDVLWLKSFPHTYQIEFHILHLWKHKILNVLFIFPLIYLIPSFPVTCAVHSKKSIFGYFSHFWAMMSLTHLFICCPQSFHPFYLSIPFLKYFFSKKWLAMDSSYDHVLTLWNLHVTIA